MRKNCLLFVSLLVMGLVIAAPAQTPDPDYATQVKEWTTRPEFMSPLVDHLPKSSTVPSPKDVLGYYIGAPKKLTYYADALKYYRTLAAKSPRVKLMKIGKTEEGRDLIMVFVGSEDSIKNLDIYKRNLARLADPRGLSDEEARKIIAAISCTRSMTSPVRFQNSAPTTLRPRGSASSRFSNTVRSS